MDRQEIGKRVREVFTSRWPARDAALSDVEIFFDDPVDLRDQRLEVGPEVLPNLDLLRRAIGRGDGGPGAAHRIPTGEEASAAPSLLRYGEDGRRPRLVQPVGRLLAKDGSDFQAPTEARR